MEMDRIVDFAAFAIIAAFLVMLLVGVLRVLYSPIWGSRRKRPGEDPRRHES